MGDMDPRDRVVEAARAFLAGHVPAIETRDTGLTVTYDQSWTELQAALDALDEAPR